MTSTPVWNGDYVTMIASVTIRTVPVGLWPNSKMRDACGGRDLTAAWCYQICDCGRSSLGTTHSVVIQKAHTSTASKKLLTLKCKGRWGIKEFSFSANKSLTRTCVGRWFHLRGPWRRLDVARWTALGASAPSARRPRSLTSVLLSSRSAVGASPGPKSICRQPLGQS